MGQLPNSAAPGSTNIFAHISLPGALRDGLSTLPGEHHSSGCQEKQGKGPQQGSGLVLKSTSSVSYQNHAAGLAQQGISWAQTLYSEVIY